MHHHQVHDESLQLWAIPHDPRPGPAGRWAVCTRPHPVLVILGDLIRSRDPRLFTLGSPRPTATALTHRRRGLPGIIVFRGRTRRVLAVPRQQVLQKYSSLASLPVKTSLASTNSDNCPAITAICPSRAAICASRSTTSLISSSRDISSGAGTRRSHRTHDDHTGTDTPLSPTVTRPKHTRTLSTPGECLLAAGPVGPAVLVRNDGGEADGWRVSGS